MKAPSLLTRAGNVLRNRMFRNIVLFASLLLLAHGMNFENDGIHHYGFMRSPAYAAALLGGLAMQILLVAVNNGVLVPKVLARKRRLLYILLVLLLIVSSSLCYVLGLKLALRHIDVRKLEMVGVFPDSLTASWTPAAIAWETWGFTLMNAIWVALFTMAWYMNDYARQRRLTDVLQRQQAETELAFLRSQLAPHFLFNTLNNIYALTLRESSAAPEAMLKLSTILRSLLYESGSAMVAFEKEAEIIRAYTDLELLRLKSAERMRFEVHADRDYAIPPLLWLPVLENIFKHGTRIISPELFVEFSFTIADNKLVIRGRNYCKEPAASKSPESGIGLKNLERRLKLLYPGRHTLRAFASDNIFTTEVIVTLS